MSAEEISIADFGSRLQIQSISLRNDVLRKPLGLEFSSSDLLAENDQVHIVALRGREVIGCMLLVPLDNGWVKMRQVAVSPVYQGRGTGRRMVAFAEEWVVKNQKSHMVLHARESAVLFYQNLGYQTDGDMFYEVGIPHYKMFKDLNKD